MKIHIIFVTAIAAIVSCTKPQVNETLPILAWYSIPDEYTSVERYKEMADCGFNLSYSYLDNLENVEKALDCAQKAGVKLIAACDEIHSRTDYAVKRIKGHPALYGYFLRDEPLPPAFKELGEWAEAIRQADSTHALYLNLFPSYVSEEAFGCSYREYVRRFIDEVGLPLVSFDNYPIVTDGIRQQWYQNLEIISEESRAAGLPFWAFALSCPHVSYPMPTMASLRIQQYTNLAYGAQGIQYFTYWTPDPTPVWDFHAAPIELDGSRTPTYDLVKELNKELQARAGVFIGSRVISTAHTGKVIPPFTKPLEKLPEHVLSLSTSADGAVVSVLEKGGSRYLVVVNRSVTQPLELSASFDRKVCMIDREGKDVKASRHVTEYTVEEGDCIIFRYRK